MEFLLDAVVRRMPTRLAGCRVAAILRRFQNSPSSLIVSRHAEIWRRAVWVFI
jgi:hypothetical protein